MNMKKIIVRSVNNKEDDIVIIPTLKKKNIFVRFIKWIKNKFYHLNKEE